MSSSLTARDGTTWILWHYTPSIAAGAIFAAIFFLLTAGHTYRLFKYRTLFFIPVVVGGLFETVGYGDRIWAHFNKKIITPYVTQSVLLLVAPALFAATIYMTLGRIMLATHGEKFSLIRINWLTKIFVAGDIFSFLVQSSGAGMIAGSETSKRHLGETIIIVGLFIQIAIFALFIVVAFVFHRNIQKYPTPASCDSGLPWKQSIRTLYLTSGLVMARNIFRVIQYIMGQDSYLLETEWPLYLFDAVLMSSVMVLLYVCYPNKIRRKEKVELIAMNTKPSETNV